MLENLNGVNPNPQSSSAEVSQQRPCPLCGKPDWCFLINDGNTVVCARTDNPPPGWEVIGRARDNRPIFINKSAQRHWEGFCNSNQPRKINKQHDVSLPLHNEIRLIPQAKEDIPRWSDLGLPIKGEVERQVIYSYPDPTTGEPLGRIIRRQWSDRRAAYHNNKRTKSFTAEHWIASSDPKRDKWVTGKGEQPWSLYREAEVRASIACGEAVIFYVAGEQAVESLRKLGLTAFCNQGGEGAAIDQIKKFLETYKPKLLVIWADYDAQGERTKIKLLRTSESAGILAVAIEPLQIWSEMPPKGDITDVLENSGMESSEIIRRLESEILRTLSQHQQKTSALDQAQQKLPAPAVLAKELASEYGQQLAFDSLAHQFLRYETELPGVWSRLPDIEVQAIIQTELDSRPQTIGKYGIAYVKSISELMKGYLQVKDWDQSIDLLPFQNGVLNLKTYEFLPHTPSYHLTWTLPRDYNPTAADWRRISAWMDEATRGDATVKLILCCWLNACLKGRADIQRFLHLIGPGGSGKGTFMNLCVALVGRINVYSSTLKDWCENRFEASNAYGKRLVIFWDEDKYRGGLNRFKSLTGGDLLRGEIKNKQAFQFRYVGMVMMASNFSIFEKDNSSGMARRTLIVPFRYPVPSSKRRNLETEFEEELAALTNYILSIPDKLVTQTLLQVLKPSSEVLQQTWENQIQENSVAAWLNDFVIVDKNAETQIGNDKSDSETLFGSYYQYCDQIGVRPLSGNQFTPTLLDLCQNVMNIPVHKGRNNQFHYCSGLRLRTLHDDDISLWQENFTSNHDGLAECDRAVIAECDGANVLSRMDCAGSDELSHLQGNSGGLNQIASDISTLHTSMASSSPITPISAKQDRVVSNDDSSQVLGEPPNTLVTSHLEVIKIGSEVRKRCKQGWWGKVCDIKGEYAEVQWHLDKYTEFISLAELELVN